MLLSVRSAEWGELRIALTVDGSDVHASVIAECETAREAIVSQLDDLRTRLKGQGLRLGEFRVSVERPSGPSGAEAGTERATPENPSAPRSLRSQIVDLRV
jgi:flagellar hook-length control protein FliK